MTELWLACQDDHFSLKEGNHCSEATECGPILLVHLYRNARSTERPALGG